MEGERQRFWMPLCLHYMENEPLEVDSPWKHISGKSAMYQVKEIAV